MSDMNSIKMKMKQETTHRFHPPHPAWQHIPHTPHILCRHCGHRPPRPLPGNPVHQNADGVVIAVVWQLT